MIRGNVYTVDKFVHFCDRFVCSLSRLIEVIIIIKMKSIKC